MRLRTKDLTRTHLGFPSEWKGKCIEGGEVFISYRYGKIRINHNNVLILETSKDDFDVGGYMEDKELFLILTKNGFVEE